MILVRTQQALHQILQKINGPFGFVPTMGALHEGHISLIDVSKQENATTICSIFVNPTQFNNELDYKNYPKAIEKDIEMLISASCDILFIPSIDEVYVDSSQTSPIDLGGIEKKWEGEFRPGHFAGVVQVVDKLLRIVGPDRLYLGEKDLQQTRVIRKWLESARIPKKPILRIIKTLREPDGLAMSSRNLRLNGEQRNIAAFLSKNLVEIAQSFNPPDHLKLIEKAKKDLEEKGFKIDYLAIVHGDNLSRFREIDQSDELYVIAAVQLGEIRLIDNVKIPFEKSSVVSTN